MGCLARNNQTSCLFVVSISFPFLPCQWFPKFLSFPSFSYSPTDDVMMEEQYVNFKGGRGNGREEVASSGVWGYLERKGKELESFLSNTAHASHFPAISPIPFLFPTMISSASDLCKVADLATHLLSPSLFILHLICPFAHLMFYKCVLF